MNICESVKDRIESLCTKQNITINDLSYRCGVNSSTIYSIFKGTKNGPCIKTIKKICDGFEITIPEFFNTFNFENLEQELK